MSFVFDKHLATDSPVWVDSVIGRHSSVFSTSGQMKRGSIEMLAQNFHPQELNYGPYFRLKIHLDNHHIDELIQHLQRLKSELS
ncbi:hypothetical protein [Citrobacter braakii]|uniref:hypothetical protein n=1 Tax=Citrobacter braakii TaxID=57706 RepID=UPI00403A223D